MVGVTVLEVIQRSAEFLSKKGVESPRLQAELLLAHVLKLPRMQLYLNFERQLTPPELDASRELIKRRSQREPLQQILGSTSFCGYEIALNRHVLVPRPETELLAEKAWLFLAGLAKQGPAAALDFGTGSGCIAIALAAKVPAAQVYALELSPPALAVAQENAKRNGVGERIGFFEGDGFAVLPGELRFELIVSNPPYIPSAEIPKLQPEVRDFEPHQALDGGVDGLNFYRLLASQAGAYMKPEGKLMLEFGDGQAESIRNLFEEQNWIVDSIEDDYTQRPRILSAHKKS